MFSRHLVASLCAGVLGWLGATHCIAALPTSIDSCTLPACVVGEQGTPGDDSWILPSTQDATASASLNAGEILISIIATDTADATAATRAFATGIDAAGGNDTFRNYNDYLTSADATTLAGNVTIWVDDAADATAAILAFSDALGFVAGDGDDTFINGIQFDTLSSASAGYGDLTFALLNNASAGSVNALLHAEARATGIVGEAGKDTIRIDTGEVYTKARASTASGALSGAAFGNGVADTGATANATATGIDGGAADDTVKNWASVEVLADAVIGAGQLGLQIVEGFGNAVLARDATAVATGIAGGDGVDTLLNGFTLDVTAKAAVVIDDVTIAPLFLEPFGENADIDSSPSALADATGIAGGAGDDIIDNAYTMNVHADPLAQAFALDVALFGNASATTGARVYGYATGIAGDAGKDRLTNNFDSTITVRATPLSVLVASTGVVTFVPVIPVIFSGADVGSAVVASAIGMRGGDDDDDLINNGTINAIARPLEVAVQAGIDVGISVEGKSGGGDDDPDIDLPSPDVGITSSPSAPGRYATGNTGRLSIATGLAGDGGSDTIDNNHVINVDADADLHQIEADSGIGIEIGFDTASVAVAGASANTSANSVVAPAASSAAESTAPESVVLYPLTVEAKSDIRTVGTGIDGGADNDTITNRGSITVTPDVTMNAVTVTADIELPELGISLEAFEVKTDASTDINVRGVGIAGGDHDDTITNNANKTITVTSHGTATSVSATYEPGVAIPAPLFGYLKDPAADANVKVSSEAIGIHGDRIDSDDQGAAPGRDEINNHGTVTAEAFGNANAVTATGNLGGAAVGNAAIEMEGRSRGIAGGAQTDHITNTGTITSKSEVKGIGFAVQASLLLGATVGSGQTALTADSTGITGDAGGDVIRNQASGTISASALADSDITLVDLVVVPGAAIGNASSSASATALGIDGGGDGDDIGSAGEITADAIARINARSISAILMATGFSDFPLPQGARAGSLGPGAVADATAIDGGGGDDYLHWTDRLTANAIAHADSLLVAFAGTGAALGDAVVDAQAIARGVHGGIGNDDIDVDGEVSADATATSGSLSLSVSGLPGPGGAAVTSGSETRATAIGVDGGEGVDSIHTTRQVRAAACAHSGPDGNDDDCPLPAAKPPLAGATGVAVSLINPTDGSLVDATTLTEAEATALAGGEGGDHLLNKAALISVADAESRSTSVTASGIGTADALLSTTVSALASGMAGGDDGDWLQAASSVEVTANATAATTIVDVVVGGIADVNATTLVNASAHGLDGGAGIDVIDIDASLSVNAHASTTGDGWAVTLFGVGSQVAGLDVDAFAVGALGGDDTDIVTNRALITLSSVASAHSDSVNVNLIGATRGEAGLAATAALVGLAGDDGDDFLYNENIIDASASSTATFSSVDFTFGGQVTSVVGNADSVADTLVSGMRGGSGRDTLDNSGQILIDTTATVTTEAGATISVFGVAGTHATMAAQPFGVGIHGDDDNDTIVNTSVVDVASHAVADLLDQSAFTFGGQASDTADVGAHAAAAGLLGGSGNDGIDNRATLTALADATLEVASGSTVVIGAARSTGLSGATADVAGIGGGDGDDVLINRGSTTATAALTSDVVGSAFAVAGDPSANPMLSTTSHAAGITGDLGSDVISNLLTGRVAVTAAARPKVSGDTRAVFDFGTVAGSAQLQSTVIAEGLDGGVGDNELTNYGVIDVVVDSEIEARNSAQAGLFLGDTESTSNASASLFAAGLKALHGNNELTNSGDVTTSLSVRGSQPDAGPSLLARADALGPPGGVTITSDAYGTAIASLGAELHGMHAGDGGNLLHNSGSLTVTLAPQVEAFASADGDGFDGDGWGTARVWLGESAPDAVGAPLVALATGMSVGDGNNDLINEERIVVSASPKGTASANVDGDLFGSAEADLASTVHATAVGMQAGDGINMLVNEGTLQVSTSPAATVTLVKGKPTGPGAAAVAMAYGIRVGDGGNRIFNSGTIDVSAAATATAPAALATTTDAIAVAILSGSGDDVIEHAGSGILRVTNGGTPGVGTAIDSGAGDDELHVRDSAAVHGDVLLRDGDDLIAFVDSAVINGRIDGGAGRDTLRIDDRRQLALVSGNVHGVEQIDADQGVVITDSDYALLDGGGLKVELYDGGHGQMAVSGVAAIGAQNTLAVVATPQVYSSGDSYDVLVGDAVSGRFESHDLTQSQFLGFSVSYLPDTVQVMAGVRPFAAAASDPTERAVAAHLDRLAATASGDLADVIAAFQLVTTDDEVDTAFRSLSPELHGSLTRAAQDGVIQVAGLVDLRLQTRYANRQLSADLARAWQGTTGSPLLLTASSLAPAVAPLHAADSSPTAVAAAPQLWGAALGRIGDRETGGGYTGFDYLTRGVAFGVDMPVGDALLLGAASAYTWTDVDYAAAAGHGNVEGWSVALYGEYALPRGYLRGSLSYGQNDYRAERNLTVGALRREAVSDHDGDSLVASVGGGYPIVWDAAVLEPFVRVDYARIDEDGYRERGAGSANQIVGARRTEALRSALGVRATQTRDLDNGRLTTSASAAWLHDFDIDDQAITARYAGAPASAFTVPGRGIDNNGLQLGIGVAYDDDKGLSTSLRYEGEFHGDDNSHALIGQIRLRF